MTRCPIFLALELGLAATDLALRLIDPIVAPLIDPIWDHFAALVLPEDTTSE